MVLIPVILVLSAVSTATPGRTVVLESHRIPRTARVAKMAAAVAAAMGSRTLNGRRLEAEVTLSFGRAARPLERLTLSRAATSVTTADQEMYAGKWEKAVQLLLPVLNILSRAVLSVANSRDVLRLLQDVRLKMAECYLKLGKKRRAWILVGDILRSQPDFRPDPSRYAGLRHLFIRVINTRRTQKATVRITTSPPGALVFLSGRNVGFSPVKVTGVYQGDYKLLVVASGKVSRIQRLRLNVGHQAVHLDLKLHHWLETKRLHKGQGDADELGFALSTGRRLSARRVILLGARMINGREALAGRVIEVQKQRIIRAGYVLTDKADPSSRLLENFGHFLLGSRRVPGILVPGKRSIKLPKKPRRPLVSKRRRRFRTAGATLLALGLAGLATGAALLALDGRATSISGHLETRAVWQFRTGGIVATSVAGAAIGVGIGLLVYGLRKREQPRVSIDVVPQPGGARIIGGIRW